MTDVVDPKTRSRMMSGIRGKNTKPEILVRSGLHRKGFRFKLHDKTLPGKPDIVLSMYRAVINIHGCFWHGHLGCRYFKVPSTRSEFWLNKIQGNQIRDELYFQQLRDSCWRVLTVWECAMRGRKADSIDETIEGISKWLKSDSMTCLVDESNPVWVVDD